MFGAGSERRAIGGTVKGPKKRRRSPYVIIALWKILSKAKKEHMHP